VTFGRIWAPKLQVSGSSIIVIIIIVLVYIVYILIVYILSIHGSASLKNIQWRTSAQAPSTQPKRSKSRTLSL